MQYYFPIQDRAALSASLRALGIFIMFPCYLTDTTFHMDVTEALLPNLPLVKVRLLNQSLFVGLLISTAVLISQIRVHFKGIIC